MIKRFWILAVIALASVLGFLIWRNARPPEPVFEGRTFTSWVDQLGTAYGSPEWYKAEQAVRKIGTNGIPTLLQMLRVKDRPAIVTKLMEAGQRMGWTRLQRTNPTRYHQATQPPFAMLGSNGVSAVPELIRIYTANISPSSQHYTALALCEIGRGAQAALPVLLSHFNDTNLDVRSSAVMAAAMIGGDPEVLIPALTTALNDPLANVRQSALTGLGKYGARARPAVPGILKMLNDKSSFTQGQVEKVLFNIAPEKVRTALVVEEQTPLISNGVAVQALKLVHLGERKTIIPPGHSLPAVFERRMFDPRPYLSLYRGAGDSEEADHLLGHFEVLGGPDPRNNSVSLFCIISDGRITICASDIWQGLGLAIRRIEPKDSK